VPHRAAAILAKEAPRLAPVEVQPAAPAAWAGLMGLLDRC
jgi:hypothetical protein